MRPTVGPNGDMYGLFLGLFSWGAEVDKRPWTGWDASANVPAREGAAVHIVVGVNALCVPLLPRMADGGLPTSHTARHLSTRLISDPYESARLGRP